MKLVDLLESPIKDYIRKKSEAGEDLFVKDTVDKFTQLKNSHKLSGVEKDITFWMNKPFQSFLTFINNSDKAIPKKQQKKSVKRDAIKVLDNKKYLIIIPLTREACQFYGAGTQWCISGNSYNEFRNYFNEGSTTIFIIIDKQHKAEKLAVLFNQDIGELSVYDATNDDYNEDYYSADSFKENTGLTWDNFHHWYELHSDLIEEYRHKDSDDYNPPWNALGVD